MSWYTPTVPHDGIRRGQVVWLADTPDVAMRLERGWLEPAEEPEWHRQLPEERQWPISSSETTEQ